MVNPRYLGEGAIAITRFRTDYNYLVAVSPEALTEQISESSRVHGSKFKVLKVYEGIDIAAATPLIQKAAEKLKRGEQVNLEVLLE